MSGSQVFLLGLIFVIGLVICVLILSIRLSAVANRSVQACERLLDTVESQAKLIASSDALTYQAIHAAEHFGSYDDGSVAEEPEEQTHGAERDFGDGLEAFEGDRLVQGRIFE